MVEAALNQLERRCRIITGLVLAAVAFVATYGILLVEGQSDRPVFHIYPWLVAVLLYLAGDLLAMVWFKLVGIQLQRMVREMEQKLRLEAEVRRLALEGDETEDTLEM